jgi:hypothetical protein
VLVVTSHAAVLGVPVQSESVTQPQVVKGARVEQTLLQQSAAQSPDTSTESPAGTHDVHCCVVSSHEPLAHGSAPQSSVPPQPSETVPAH